jgi:hypothetical protein
MSAQQKDALDRLIWTLVLAGVSFGTVYLTDVNELWGFALLAALQTLKNEAAKRVGDPDTAGFVDTRPNTTLEPLPPLTLPDESPASPDDIPGLDEDDLGEDDGSVL